MQSKVLVITDRPDLPQISTQMLLLSGIEVSVQDDKIGTGATSASVLEFYDLVLINLYERPGDSVELCRQLRAQYNNPILVILPERDEELMLRVFEAGAEDCLVQPLDHRLLVAIIKAWRRRARHSRAGDA